jgi:hypothetical protein
MLHRVGDQAVKELIQQAQLDEARLIGTPKHRHKAQEFTSTADRK